MQKQNKEENFWSSEESDEDFEKMIGVSNTNKETVESVFSILDEKVQVEEISSYVKEEPKLRADTIDFIWSDDEEQEDFKILDKKETDKFILNEQVSIDKYADIKETEDIITPCETDISITTTIVGDLRSIFEPAELNLTNKVEEVNVRNDVIAKEEVVETNLLKDVEDNNVKEDTIVREEVVGRKLQKENKEDKYVKEYVVEDFNVQKTHSDYNLNNQIMEITSNKAKEAKNTSKPRPSDTILDSKLNNPLCIFIGTKLFTVYNTKQKRLTREGHEKMVSVNIYKTLIPVIPQDIYNKNILEGEGPIGKIYKLLNLSEFHSENISEIIGSKNTIFCTKRFSETYEESDINMVLNINKNILSRKMVIEYCINKRMWSLALLLSDNDLNIKNKILLNILDKDMVGLYTGDSSFIFEKDWIYYFKFFLNIQNPSDSEIVLIRKYISYIYKSSTTNALLVLVSLHLNKVYNIGHMLYLFAMNDIYLYILQLVDSKEKIINLDLLMYQYITSINLYDMNRAKEYYKLNKKMFRKELQDELNASFKLKWNFGFKEVFNYGISKILDENIVENVKNEDIVEDINTMKEDGLTPSTNLEQVSITHLVQNTTSLNENINKLNIKQKEVNMNNSFKTKEKEVYAEQNHSKSFVDFFETDKMNQEIRTEDDTSLFLSDYNIKDDEIGIKKGVIEPEGGSSLFNIFNIFKKKSYKIDVQAQDDIKYDPVTKKWVSSSTISSPKSIVIQKGQDVPKPISCSAKSFTAKKIPLYAGKKPTKPTFNTAKKPSDDK